MNKLLEKVNLPKQTQEEIENLISTDHQENLIVINNFSQCKYQAHMTS